MLKIKFNINEFTIIFLRRFEGKKMNAKESPSASTSFNVPLSCFSVSFLLQPPFLLQCLLFAIVPPFVSFLFVSAFFLFPGSVFSAPSLFLFSVSFFFFSTYLSFLFSSRVALFFNPKTFFFSPKQFSLQPKTFLFCACLLLKMKSNHLPQNQEGPAFHANSQAKKEKSSFNLHSSKTQYSL